MTQALFQEDAYLQSCKATVTAVDGEWVELDQTVCYPLGGGQPGDQGEMSIEGGRKIAILDTRKGEAGAIRHQLTPEHGLSVGDAVQVQLDWSRRYAHMRMHTALHLLGSLIPFGVTGGNIGAEKGRLDFDMEESPDKDDLSQRLNQLIQAGYSSSTRWITDAELDAQPELVRTMSVQPPRGAGRIRLLEIAGVDLQPCGGTHVKNTSEIGPIRVSKIEKKGKHNRRVVVEFVAE